LDHLAERLEARLNDCAQRAELIACHVPERAFRFGETLSDAAPASPWATTGYRPLSLFSCPRAIKVTVRPSESREGQPVAFTDAATVHRLAPTHGPERITGQWWNGHWKTRDYFDVLDVTGNRYWLFRVAETGRWFLHGVFE
jgi:protein ImuB